MTDPMLDMLRRDERETSFDSECRITAQGEGFMDDDGVWHPPANPVIYEGPCSFLPQQAMTRTTETAGQVVEVHPYKVRVPRNTPVERGHAVTVTACPDTGAVGRSFTVEAVQFSQWQTTRVLGCEEAVA